MAKTPYDRMKESNDAYHEAIDEILEEKKTDVNIKARVGSISHSIFALMLENDTIVKEIYEKEKKD